MPEKKEYVELKEIRILQTKRSNKSYIVIEVEKDDEEAFMRARSENRGAQFYKDNIELGEKLGFLQSKKIRIEKKEYEEIRDTIIDYAKGHKNFDISDIHQACAKFPFEHILLISDQLISEGKIAYKD